LKEFKRYLSAALGQHHKDLEDFGRPIWSNLFRPCWGPGPLWPQKKALENTRT
jgi:hypothetical protein